MDYLNTNYDRCHCCNSSCLIIYYPDLALCKDCDTIAAIDRRTTAVYDAAYVAERYDRYPTTETMSELRCRFVEAGIDLHEFLPDGYREIWHGKLLDVGFGNGSFIRTASRKGWDAYGCDVNPTEYPGVRRVELPLQVLPVEERYRVITFFDAIEHFEDLRPLKTLVHNTEWIFISVPLPPPSFPAHRTWKHFRPGEHHYHFRNPFAFEKLFLTDTREAKIRYIGTPEDAIRKTLADGRDNIQTIGLHCRDRVTT